MLLLEKFLLDYGVYILVISVVYAFSKTARVFIKRTVIEASLRSVSYSVISAIAIVLYIIIFANIVGHKVPGLFTSLGFLSAALVVSLQGFVASFFAFIFVVVSGILKVGDIIKTGNPFMITIGKIKRIGVFYIEVAEMDEKMYGTGKTIYLPNNQLLSNGIFHYTPSNDLFWIESTITISPPKSLETIKNILQKHVTKILDERQINTTQVQIHSVINQEGVQFMTRTLVPLSQMHTIQDLLNEEYIAMHNAHKWKILFKE